MLNSAVKSRKFLNFPIFFSGSACSIRVYFYRPITLLGTNEIISIVFNIKLTFSVAIFSKLYEDVFTILQNLFKIENILETSLTVTKNVSIIFYIKIFFFLKIFMS